MNDTTSLADRAALVVPPTPRWVPWAAGLLGLALTVLRVALEGRSDLAVRVVVAVAGVLTPLFFVAAGIGAALEVWRRREWRRRTQFLAVEAVDRLRVALGDLAGAVVDVVREAAPESAEHRPDVRDAFVLPFTAVRRRVLDEATAMVLPLQGLALAHELGGRSSGEDEPGEPATDVRRPADADLVRDRLAGAAAPAAPALAELAARVRAEASDVARLVEREGQALLPEALELELRAASLARPSRHGGAAGDVEDGDLRAATYLLTTLSVLLGCATCMRLLDDVNAAVRRRGDGRLPAFVAAMEAAGGQMHAMSEEAVAMRLDAMATSRTLARLNDDGERLLASSRQRSAARRRRLADLGVAATPEGVGPTG